jgi:hypothetical protein
MIAWKQFHESRNVWSYIKFLGHLKKFGIFWAVVPQLLHVIKGNCPTPTSSNQIYAAHPLPIKFILGAWLIWK